MQTRSYQGAFLHGCRIFIFDRIFFLTPHSDVEIAIGDRVFRVHRAVLCARSSWFKAMLAERWRQDHRRIEISSFTPQVFEAILQYLYTGYRTYSFICCVSCFLQHLPHIKANSTATALNGDNAQDVLEAANLMNDMSLLQLAEEVLAPVPWPIQLADPDSVTDRSVLGS